MLAKPNKKKLTIASAATLSLLISFLAVYSYLSRPKIAYVRSLEVVYSFNGMRQAHSEYKSQTDEWQANMDTLRRQYTQAIEDYKNNSAKLSDKEKKQKEEEIKRLESSYKNYASAVNKEAQEKDKKMTESILNQVSSYIESYAKKKGFDIVLGAQGNGSVLYATKAFDITDEVIAEMNKDYKVLPLKDATAVK